MQSIPQLAEKLGVKTKNLRKRLKTENYMGKVDGKWTLTDKGIEAGGIMKPDIRFQ
jgi:phage antirepressor YoqD-like protein|tara:strand:- start:10 stop:177 length:168 start_codon:yes stop_codon:yes gene_type:complete